MVFLQQFMGKGCSGLHNSDQGQGISLPMNSMDPFSPYPSNTHGSAPKKTLKLYCNHILSKNPFSDSHLSNSEYWGQKYLSGKYWGQQKSSVGWMSADFSPACVFKLFQIVVQKPYSHLNEDQYWGQEHTSEGWMSVVDQTNARWGTVNNVHGKSTTNKVKRNLERKYQNDDQISAHFLIYFKLTILTIMVLSSLQGSLVNQNCHRFHLLVVFNLERILIWFYKNIW